MKLLLFVVLMSVGALTGFQLYEPGRGVGIDKIFDQVFSLLYLLVGAAAGALVAGLSLLPKYYFRHGTATCTRTGIWIASVGFTHPQAATFKTLDRTAFVRAGELFPDPTTLVADIEAADVSWRWLRARRPD